MEQLRKDACHEIEPLFAGFPGLHGALDAAFEGLHGDVFVDDAADPRIARVVIGDFHAVAGDPHTPAAGEMLRAVPQRDYLAVPDSWHDFVRKTLPDARPHERFAFRAPERWDRTGLAAMRRSLPLGFALRRVDINTFNAFREMNPTFVDNFRSSEDFLQRGVGFAVTSGGRIVAGCSSYSISPRCLEFEIETRREFQRRGLALVTGARMIEHCLEAGLEPCWDAAHDGSARLAERLGFVDCRPYTAYRIGADTGPPDLPEE
jgi:hypothetical protein